jgi:hypothetical protein
LDGVGGVCCFSAIPDSLLMWGHYAQSHQGFCLEFSTSRDKMFQKSKRVRYADSLPSINTNSLVNGDFAQIMQLVLTKARCWEYEQEWRVLHTNAELLYGYERDSLTGVYFGAKMPEAQMAMVASLLENTYTKLYRMRLSSSTFSVVAEQLDFRRIDYRNPPHAKSAS